MKSIIQFMFLSLLFTALSCGGSADTSTTDESETTSTPPEQTEQSAETPETQEQSNAAYTINVVDEAPKSPRKEMKGTIDGVDITVNYGSPYVKGRKILGELIPFGSIWRCGADKCTSITLSKDAVVGGQKLPAGTYGLFTLNTADNCEVIFNTVSDQWGAYDYDKSKDALRINVERMMAEESTESMDFMIEGNNVVLAWEKVRIPFAVAAG